MVIRLLISLLILQSTFLISVSAEIHDVPSVKQDAKADCAPAGAASCLGWFQAHGYPLISDRNGDTDLKKIEVQLEGDANTHTEEKGTDIIDLAKAINRLFSEAQGKPYEHTLLAEATPPTKDPTPPEKKAVEDLEFLDTHFQNGEDVLLSFCFVFEGNKRAHVVTVRNVTHVEGTPDNQRLVEFMNPASGQVESFMVSDTGHELRLEYRGLHATICGFVTVAPKHYTRSSHHTGLPTIRYNPYFPANSRTKDLHIKIKDADRSHYNVLGLPQGWIWDTHEVDGQLYLSMYQPQGASDLENGQAIDVEYLGQGKIEMLKDAIIQTTSGQLDPRQGRVGTNEGYTVVDATDSIPTTPVQKVRCGVTNGDPNNLTVTLAWDASPDQDIVAYEVRFADSDEILATTTTNAITLTGLESDAVYKLVVTAKNTKGLSGPSSEPITFHQDALQAPAVMEGYGHTLDYVSALDTWMADYPLIELTPSNISVAGNLYVTRLGCLPLVDVPAPWGSAVKRTFHLWTDAQKAYDEYFDFKYHYDVRDFVGAENGYMELYRYDGSSWDNLDYIRVDTDQKVIEAPYMGDLGTIALVNTLPQGCNGAEYARVGCAWNGQVVVKATLRGGTPNSEVDTCIADDYGDQPQCQRVRFDTLGRAKVKFKNVPYQQGLFNACRVGRYFRCF